MGTARRETVKHRASRFPTESGRPSRRSAHGPGHPGEPGSASRDQNTEAHKPLHNPNKRLPRCPQPCTCSPPDQLLRVSNQPFLSLSFHHEATDCRWRLSATAQSGEEEIHSVPLQRKFHLLFDTRSTCQLPKPTDRPTVKVDPLASPPTKSPARRHHD